MITITKANWKAFEDAEEKAFVDRMLRYAASVCPHRVADLPHGTQEKWLQEVRESAWLLGLTIEDETRALLWYFLEFGLEFGNESDTSWAALVLGELDAADRQLDNLAMALVQDLSEDPGRYRAHFVEDRLAVERMLASLPSPPGQPITRLAELLPRLLGQIDAFVEARTADEPVDQIAALDEISVLLADWREG
jgi:hypothetical protein